VQPFGQGPRAGVPLDEEEATLRLEHGVKVRHGVDVLDTSDAPTGEVAHVDAEAGEVSWAYRIPDRVAGAETSAASVRRTANLRLIGSPTFPLEARRLRLWTELLSPRGNWLRWHLGVFVIPPAAVADDGVLLTRDLDLADKTYRYANRTLVEALRVDAGTVAVEWVRNDLAARFGETGFAFTASTTTLTEPKTFEAGTSYLEVYNHLLEGVAYDQLVVDEDGRPQARPLVSITSRGPEVTYGPGTPIVTAGRVEALLPTLPNVLRFVARQGPTLPEEGNGVRTVRNQTTGPASIRSRGEEIEQRVEVDAESQAELDAVAAADAQRYFAGGGIRYSGEVGLQPRFSDRDVIGLRKPRLGLIGGEFVVTSWTYPLRAIQGEGDVVMPITCEQRVLVS
jgi:hypothetical protein